MAPLTASGVHVQTLRATHLISYLIKLFPMNTCTANADDNNRLVPSPEFSKATRDAGEKLNSATLINVVSVRQERKKSFFFLIVCHFE